MLWPPFARMARYLLTWGYLCLLITLCMPSTAAWVEVVHGSFQLWLIVECGRRGDSKKDVKTAKWKRRNRKGPITRLQLRLGHCLETAANLIDRLITWAIGDEPTDKERLTWTSAEFRNQKRVRKGMSSGKGFNKRHLGTSLWHKTAAIICLVATTGRAETTRFDSDSVTLHVDNCASRCITHTLSDFVRPPQKVIGRVKGMGGDTIAVSAVGTIRWTFDDDDDGVSHAFLIPGCFLPNIGRRNVRMIIRRRTERGKLLSLTTSNSSGGRKPSKNESPSTSLTSHLFRLRQDASNSGCSGHASKNPTMIFAKTKGSPLSTPH